MVNRILVSAVAAVALLFPVVQPVSGTLHPRRSSAAPPRVAYRTTEPLSLAGPSRHPRHTARCLQGVVSLLLLVAIALGCHHRLTFHCVPSFSPSRGHSKPLLQPTPNFARARALWSSIVRHGVLRAVSSSAVDRLSTYAQWSSADSCQPRHADSATSQLCAAPATRADWRSTHDAANGLQPSIWHAASVQRLTVASRCDGNSSCFWIPCLFDARLFLTGLIATDISAYGSGQDRWAAQPAITSTESDERTEHNSITDELAIFRTAYGHSDAIGPAQENVAFGEQSRCA